MGHLSLSEIAVQFVNTEIIARCYNHIFTWRGYTARFQEEVDQSEALLKTCQPGEWMQTFSRLRKRGDLKAMQEFLKEDFLRQVQLMTNACRQLRERRKVLDIFAFNKAVNQMLSLCSFFLCRRKRSMRFMLRCQRCWICIRTTGMIPMPMIFMKSGFWTEALFTVTGKSVCVKSKWLPNRIC